MSAGPPLFLMVKSTRWWRPTCTCPACSGLPAFPEHNLFRFDMKTPAVNDTAGVSFKASN